MSGDDHVADTLRSAGLAKKKKRGFMIEDLLREDGDGKCFTKRLISVEKNYKFKIKRRIYKILFNDLAKCDDPKQSLLDSVNETLQIILYEDPKVTKVGLSMQSKALNDPVEIPFMDIKRDIIQVLSNSLFKLGQSERLVPLFNHPLNLSICTYRPPIGSGFDPLMGNIDFDNMITVNLNDNFCLFHSILASMSYSVSKGIDSKQKRHRNLYDNVSENRDILSNAALKLMTDSKISTQLSGYGIEHLRLVQNYFNQAYEDTFCILVFGTSSYTKPVFKGNVENPVHYLSLFYFQEHFYAIKNLNLFCSGRIKYLYCPPCESTYNQRANHSSACPRKCTLCTRIGRSYPCKPTTQKLCLSCNRTFRNIDCFNYHLKAKVCGKFIFCSECFQTYRAKSKTPHTCGDSYCSRCYVYHPKRKECFIQPTHQGKNKIVRYVIFDTETTQDTQIDENVFEHEVNFICAFIFCTQCVCEKDFMNVSCDICGPKIKKWSAPKGDNCIFDFTKWIIYDLNKAYTTIALSHWGSKFDNLFVLKQLFKFNLTPSCIKNGNKFYEIHVKKGRKTTETYFRDTFNFIQLPLSSFVKTFNLSIDEKQFFPFFFNCSKFYNLRLSHLPDKSYYSYNTMPLSNQKIFDQWYHQEYNTEFYLPDKLDEYCTNDVQILTYSVVEFRKIFMDLCGMDPFRDNCTVPGACMKMYRNNFLPKNTLALVPEYGYQKHSRCSEIALKYFTWLEFTTGKYIQHRNTPSGEYKIGPYLVDAFIDAENHVIEFYGCSFHGHPACFKPDTVLPTKRTAAKEYERTMIREKEIKELGYTLERVWECEVGAKLKKDKTMKAFFDNTILGGPINPRDGFFGGRCNPHKLYCKKEPGTVIKYYDFTSLYPACNFDVSYPIGIPEIIENSYFDQDVFWTKPSDYNITGILKVFLIPPQDLIIPVVPYKSGDFLLFPLCRTCCKQHENDETSRGMQECFHTELERGFVSTITHMELNLALEKKYVVKKFYGAYNYKKFSQNLFKSYVKKFLKLKVEADGVPPSVVTEEDKVNFVKGYKDKFDISIDPENLIKNEGIKFTSKICLNSLWGRFSLRNGLSKTLVSSDPLEVDSIVSGDTYEVSGIDLLNENQVMLVYKHKRDFIVENSASNIITSLWTTSAARIRLYEIMDKIVQSPGCQLLYTDTDSVIFSCPENYCPLETGIYLGELTDEVSPTEEIVEAVIGGNKQYALAIQNKETGAISYSLKLRGITLNAETSSQLHYQKFKEMVLDYDQNDFVELNYRRILGTRSGHVYSRNIPKKYKVFYKKGYIGDDLIVYPFGHRQI